MVVENGYSSRLMEEIIITNHNAGKIHCTLRTKRMEHPSISGPLNKRKNYGKTDTAISLGPRFRYLTTFHMAASHRKIVSCPEISN